MFLFLFHLPLRRFKLQLALVLKDTHYSKPRAWETRHVAYKPLNFQVVLRGFLITQLWTRVSPSLTKQQENSF